MKNQTIGVDPSVSATGIDPCATASAPIASIFVESLPGNTTLNIPSTVKVGPARDPLAEPAAFPTVVQIVNGVVTPSLQVLLYNVLGVIDASVPNKEQNKAIKRLIRDGFDKTYMEIIREAYPDSNMQMGEGHAIEPVENRFKAITGIVKQS